MNFKNYTQVCSTEVASATGCYAIKILVEVNGRDKPPSSDDFTFACLSAQDAVKEALITELLNENPEMHARKEAERIAILGLFQDPIFVEEIPNGYGPKGPYFKFSPWFVVTTRQGRIKIGWRRRVLEISWDESNVKLSAEELFPDEDVTKSGRLIHAWGYEKALEYVNKIVNYC